MATDQAWFVQHRGREQGPFTSKQLKQLADESKITRETMVRLGEAGEWKAAGQVRGLFPPVSALIARADYEPPARTEITTLPSQAKPPARPQPRVASPMPQYQAPLPAFVPPPNLFPVVPAQSYGVSQPPPPSQAMSAPVQHVERAPCPFCGELIAVSAIKCRHCNEFLDGRQRRQQQPRQNAMQAHAPVQNVNVTVQQTTVVAAARFKRWSPLVAMLLSFIFPGLGQLYKGQLISGFVWFVAVVVGYAAFVAPGLLLHFCCIAGAGMGDPYR